jgi:hypothetical protein
MARDRLTFRRRDVTAAIKAVEAAGHVVARIEIGQDGRITIFPVTGSEPAAEINEWNQDPRTAAP